MPTYEYHCDSCGENFEEFQQMTAQPLEVCANCGQSGAIKRIISGGAGLLFKGSGFYITDYRSSAYKEAAKADSGTPAKSTTDTKKKSTKKETTAKT